MSDEVTKTYIWRAGVTIIRHEQRIEDDAIVFGSYIDDVWRESGRMTFGGDKETKALALVALSQVSKSC